MVHMVCSWDEGLSGVADDMERGKGATCMVLCEGWKDTCRLFNCSMDIVFVFLVG